MTRPRTLRRAALAGVLATSLATLLACSTGALQAHEWPSPTPVTAQRPAARPAPGAWSGTLWAGPEAGAPMAPSARHCARAPQPFDISAGPGWETPQHSGLSRRGDRELCGRVAESAALLGKAAAPLAPSVPPAPVSMADALRSSADSTARQELATRP